MKKHFLKFLILICVFIPFVVNADMGAPENAPYDVIVINPNGTCNYDWNKEGYYKTDDCLPYGFTFTVQYEYYLKIDDDYQLMLTGNYNDKEYVIKSSDTEINGTYSSSFVYDYEGSNNYDYVYYGNVPLYNGPAFKFGKVTDNVSIPTGTTVKKYKYSAYWDYVEYNGTYGWIYLYRNRDGGDYLIAHDVDSTWDKIIIPAGNTEAYTSSDLATDSDYSTTLEFDEDTEFDVTRIADNHYYLINYKNEDYWVYNYKIGLTYKEVSRNEKVVNSFTAYSDFGLSKNETTIPAGSSISIKGNGNSSTYEIYFEYNDNYYWADYGSIKFQNEVVLTTESTVSVNTIMVEDFEEEYEHETSYSNEQRSEEALMIIYVLGGAFGLSIATIVVIILINRKKKNKNKDDKKIDEKEEKLIEAEVEFDKESSDENKEEKEKEDNKENKDEEDNSSTKE